ncbi:MAG TPA: hypothetical protein VK858_20225 [Longimicrobiales bacterium]|nr:hypothetical protein [Longimicrobiales bacterium]
MSNKLPRRYDENEVARILKRATEIRQERAARELASDGLTLDELEEIAREADIDVGHLRQAALEMDSGELQGGVLSRMAGERLTLVREISLPGEMDPEGYEPVVAAAQALAQDHGTVALLGRTLTWRVESRNKTRSTQVVVSVRGGETRIQVEENLHQMAAGLLGGTTFGAGAGIGLGVGLPVAISAGAGLLAVAVPAATMGVAFLGARQIYRHVVARRRRALAELLETVADVAREHIPGALPPSGSAPDTLPP